MIGELSTPDRNHCNKLSSLCFRVYKNVFFLSDFSTYFTPVCVFGLPMKNLTALCRHFDCVSSNKNRAARWGEHCCEAFACDIFVVKIFIWLWKRGREDLVSSPPGCVKYMLIHDRTGHKVFIFLC